MISAAGSEILGRSAIFDSRIEESGGLAGLGSENIGQPLAAVFTEGRPRNRQRLPWPAGMSIAVPDQEDRIRYAR